MFFVLAILSLVPFWASPERYLKEAEKEKKELRRENAIYYYRKCISKSPNYELRDSVYLALLDLYEEMGKNSLFLNTIDEFCEENTESNFIPILLYKKAQFFDKEYALPHSEPLKAESLYNVIINDFGKAPIAKKAIERKAYLNETISLPVGKVYKCAVCDKLLKADKILKVKRKDKSEYLKKYSTEEIKKDRCYEHQLIKVKTKVITTCPECGRKKTEIKIKECMRGERSKYFVENIESLCEDCQILNINQPNFDLVYNYAKERFEAGMSSDLAIGEYKGVTINWGAKVGYICWAFDSHPVMFKRGKNKEFIGYLSPNIDRLGILSYCQKKEGKSVIVKGIIAGVVEIPEFTIVITLTSVH